MKRSELRIIAEEAASFSFMLNSDDVCSYFNDEPIYKEIRKTAASYFLLKCDITITNAQYDFGVALINEILDEKFLQEKRKVLGWKSA